MTALASDIGTGDTTIAVDVLPTLQPYPFGVTIESEHIAVRGVGSRVLYVDRGQDGTSRATHASGTTVTTGWSGGASSTPTLAEVLVAGNDTGATAGIDTSATGLQVLQVTPSDSDAGSGALSLQGGNLTIGMDAVSGAIVSASPPFGTQKYAGQAVIQSGAYGANEYSAVEAEGATDTRDGRVILQSDGRSGSLGQPLGGDGDGYIGYFDLLSSGSGAPGSSFSSYLYLDTDTTPGDLYAWNGSSYTKVSAGV